MEAKRISPSGWFYLVGVLVFLFGCVASIMLFTVGIVGTVDSAIDVDRVINDFERVVVPGSAELVLDEPGLYGVFYEYRSVVAGQRYESSRLRPRLYCQLRDQDSGKAISLYDAWLQDTTYDMPSRSGTLLMFFEVDEASTYLLSCEYVGDKDTPKVVLAIGTNLLPNVFSLAASVVLGILAPLPLFCCGTFMGGLIVIVVALMRHRSARDVALEAN